MYFNTKNDQTFEDPLAHPNRIPVNQVAGALLVAAESLGLLPDVWKWGIPPGYSNVWPNLK
jgi:hypothetical protein